MPKVTLSRAEVDAARDRTWAIVRPVYDLLARYRHEDLSPRQQQAQLVLFYSNEIFNGGHLQHFHNQGMEHAGELLSALSEMGAAEHRANFAEALAYARQYPVEHAESIEEYSDWAYEQEFREWDDAHYALPELGNELLPRYILANLSDFVELV